MTDNNEINTDRQALEQAKQTAKEKMISDPTPANVAAFEAARAALEKLAEADAAKPVVFKNRKLALERLQADGYKIKKSKFYADCKLGLCRLEADGAVTEAELTRYARRVGLKQPALQASDAADDMLARKNEKEVERIEEQVAKLRREREIEEGRYLERAEVEMELAGKCAVLEAGLRHLFHTRLADWIEAAENHGLPAALDMAQQDLNGQFNEFADLDGFAVLIGAAAQK